MGDIHIHIFKNHFKLSNILLISYLILFLLPLGILGFIVPTRFYKTLSMQVTEDSGHHLYSISVVFENWIEQLLTMSLNFQESSAFGDFLSGNNFSSSELQTELKLWDGRIFFISEILIYPEEGNYILSSLSSYNINNLDSLFPDMPSFDEELQAFLNREKKGYIVLPVTSYAAGPDKIEVIPVLVSLPWSFSDKSCLIYLINAELFNNLLKGPLYPEDSNIILIDFKGRQLFSLLNEPLLDIPDNLNSFDQDVFSYKSSHKTYILKKIKNLNLTIINSIPDSVIQNRIRVEKQILIGSILILLLLGSLSIWAFFILTFIPIKRLRAITDDLLIDNRQNISGKKQDELLSIEEAVRKASSDTIVLKDLVVESESIRKNMRLIRILNGILSSKDQAEKKVNGISLSFPHPYFVILLTQLSGNKKEQRSSMLSRIELILQKYMSGYCGETHNKDYIFAIISLKEDNTKLIRDFHTELMADLGTVFTIGIGSIVKDWKMIPRSYLEAEQAYKYRLLRGSESLIEYRSLHSEGEGVIVYQKRMLENLHRSIIHKNEMDFTLLLKKLIDKIKNQDMSLLNAKCLSFDIINTIFHALEEMDINPNFIYSRIPDSGLLESCETIQELEERIMDLYSTAITLINGNNLQDVDDLGMQMIAYIREQYKDPQFYAVKMAEYFRISPSYLSQLFKKLTGENLKDYINSLKMEDAKSFLIDTDLSVMEITRLTGYANSSSFIRKFSNYTGLTPQNYRKEHRPH